MPRKLLNEYGKISSGFISIHCIYLYIYIFIQYIDINPLLRSYKNFLLLRACVHNAVRNLRSANKYLCEDYAKISYQNGVWYALSHLLYLQIF